MFAFVASDDFKRDLLSLDDQTSVTIKGQLIFFASMEDPLIAAKKIRGHKSIYRFRVADYRVLFHFAGKRIILLNVGHRKDVYQGL